MDLSFAKELYYKEVEVKLHLDARIGTFGLLLSALGGVTVYLVRAALPGVTLLTLLSLILSVTAAVAFFVAVVLAFLATVGYKHYKHVPYGDEWLRTWRALQEYHRDHSDAVGTPAADFAATAMDRFSSAADVNGRVNSTRSERFYWATRLLLGGIILLAVAGVLQSIPVILQFINGKGP